MCLEDWNAQFMHCPRVPHVFFLDNQKWEDVPELLHHVYVVQGGVCLNLYWWRMGDANRKALKGINTSDLMYTCHSIRIDTAFLLHSLFLFIGYCWYNSMK